MESSETRWGNSNYERQDTTNKSSCRRSIIPVQNVEEQLEKEDFETPDMDLATQSLSGGQALLRRGLLSSSLKKVLTDETLWGHIDPRTEWPEWKEVACDEGIDAMLAARRARNRQLGK